MRRPQKVDAFVVYYPKNRFMQTVLLYGNTKKKLSPVNGSTAPYAYLGAIEK